MDALCCVGEETGTAGEGRQVTACEAESVARARKRGVKVGVIV